MGLVTPATPVLRGKEAEAFEKKAKANLHKRAPKKEVEEAVKTFLAVIKNSRDLL